ncbi:NAD-dependent epimerase/dehydratase family protein [Krasilnikovia sp. MM14-A1004]|uniref:NAD-dependent epimerase/dehydratase family protein n=1 Tax=Krasilnikovia sp. MM14-A1004 TaxID=3373541 RepID=UPI00399CD44D
MSVPAAGRTVFILGATGFLGTHLGDAFAAAGWRVLRGSTTASGPGSVRLDLTADDGALAAALADGTPDVVVNASGRVWRMTDQQMLQANAAVLDHVIAALRETRPGARLVQLGSIHEYGPGTPGTATREDQPPVPVTPYGRSKLGGSLRVLEAAGHGLDGVVLRLANVCGPGTRPGSLLGAVSEHLAGVARDGRSGDAALRLPPLRAQRDFVDVRDVTDAVLATADAPAGVVTGQIINIGSGRARPVREIVDRMVALSGLDVSVEETEPTGGPSARVDVEWQLLDINRAGRLLGWRPRRGLDESLRDQLAAALAMARAATEGD